MRKVEGLGDLTQKGATAFSSELQDLIMQSNEIIVVGTADVRNRVDAERERANSRTRTLFDVVTKIRGKEFSVFRWNLGQWTGSTNVSLTDQRRIILIEVKKRTKGLDLTQGVRQALEQHKTSQPIFEQILNDYSDSRVSKIN